MRILILPFLLLGACAPRVATFDGAETNGAAERVRVATLRVVGPASAAPAVELRTADGVVRSGRLTRADRAPGLGGPDSLARPTRGARLEGTLVAGDGGAPVACRFDVLTPGRRLDGGGTGRCLAEDGRRVDFVF